MNEIESIKCGELAAKIANLVDISPELKTAFETTPRTIFSSTGDPFSLEAQSIGAKQWISSPLTVAKMTEALCADGCDKVLEIGCGSGYQAAILSKLAKRVFTIERIESLATAAKERFKELEINNVFVRFDDGSVGWSSYAPFERIILSCGCESVPAALFKQLSEGGVLVAPVGKIGSQFITQFIKQGDSIESCEIEPCEFVPLLSGREF